MYMNSIEYRFDAVTYAGEVFCNECLPDGVTVYDEKVNPIFADVEVDQFPVCSICGHEHTYMTSLMPKQELKEWLEAEGDELLRGWLRAREDGNEEDFTDWLLGEYEYYRYETDEYEVPYHGIADSPSKVELLIWTK